MKKLFLAVAAVAMVFATSCKKENVNEPEVPAGDNEFICVIDQNANPQNAPAVEDGMGTMAHIDASNNVWWQDGDEIKYYGTATGESNVTYHTLKCYKQASDGRAYFKSDEGKHFGQGTHEAYYPASLVVNNYPTLLATINLVADKNAGYLPMYGTNTEGKGGQHYLTFYNICAVLKIKIPASINDCNKIIVSADQPINGTFYVDEDVTPYKAQLHNGQTFDANKTITINAPANTTFTPYTDQDPAYVYVAIPENNYTGFTVTLKNNDNTRLSNENDKTMPVEAGKIYPITLKTQSQGAPTDQFYFKATTANSTIRLVKSGSPTSVSLNYWNEGDATPSWNDYAYDADNGCYPQINVTAGKKVYFKSTSSTNAPLASGSANYHKFSITGTVDIGGKLMSLVNATGADNLTSGTYTFTNLFNGQSSLFGIGDLIFPSVVTQSCFYQMFNGCTNLNAGGPITLPLTGATNSCYNSMFNGCSGLSQPVVIMANGGSLTKMFNGCSSLTTVYLTNYTDANGIASGTFNNILSNAGSNGTVWVSDTFTAADFSGRAASGTAAQKILYYLYNKLPSGWKLKNNNGIDNTK